MNNQNYNPKNDNQSQYPQKEPFVRPFVYNDNQSDNKNNKVIAQIHETEKELADLIFTGYKGLEIISGQVGGIRESVDSLSDKVEKATRKPKKSTVSKKIVVSPDKRLFLMTVYDDKTCTAKELTLCPFSKIEFGIVRFMEEDEKDFCYLDFGDDACGNAMLISLRYKMNSSEMHKRFLWAGVKFNEDIRESEIAKALHKFVIEIFRKEENIIYFSRKGGWVGDIYTDATDCQLLEKMNENFPVLKKSVDKILPEIEDAKLYVKQLCKIHQGRLRTILFVWPYLAIIKTLLQQQGIRFPYVTNIVVSNQWEAVKEISYFCQVFNRGRVQAIDLNMRKNQLKDVLDTMKDEVLLGYVFFHGKSKYDCNKIKGIAKELIVAEQMESFRAGDTTSIWQGVSIIVSDEPIDAGSCLTVFTDEQDFQVGHEDWETDVVAKVLYGFIRFIEDNYDEVEGWLRKVSKRQQNFEGELAIEITYALMEAYFRSMKLDIDQEVQIPKKGKWEDFMYELFLTNEECLEEVTNRFLNGLYKYSKNLHFVNTEKAVYSNAKVFFDANKIYMPVPVFFRILSKTGLNEKKNMLLAKLNELHFMNSSHIGYRNRKTIGGERVYVYCFNREKLKRAGYGDLVLMGKEQEE